MIFINLQVHAREGYRSRCSVCVSFVSLSVCFVGRFFCQFLSLLVCFVCQFICLFRLQVYLSAVSGSQMSLHYNGLNRHKHKDLSPFNVQFFSNFGLVL